MIHFFKAGCKTTNKCVIQLEKMANKYMHTALDNLLKGAIRTSSSKYEPYVWA